MDTRKGNHTYLMVGWHIVKNHGNLFSPGKIPPFDWMSTLGEQRAWIREYRDVILVSLAPLCGQSVHLGSTGMAVKRHMNEEGRWSPNRKQPPLALKRVAVQRFVCYGNPSCIR